MGDAHKKGIMKYIMKNPLDSQEARELAYQEYSDAHRDIYCLLYTSPSPRDGLLSRMPSSA